MNETNSIASVDIGNSNIKVLVGIQKFSTKYSTEWLNQTIKFIETNLKKNGIIGISSVQPQRFEELNEHLGENYKVITANKLLRSQQLIDFDEIEGIGDDRLLGLIGAIKTYNPPLITVDCGTAITINVLDVKSRCIGGAIFAGIETQLEALSKRTAQLSEVELFNEQDIIGKDTASALRNGIIKGSAGSIIYIVENIINHFFINNQVTLVLTGGTSKMILPLLEKSHLKFHFEENLVLEGLIHLIEKSNLE